MWYLDYFSIILCSVVVVFSFYFVLFRNIRLARGRAFASCLFRSSGSRFSGRCRSLN